MPSLTHVCLWDDDHWQPITAEDVVLSHRFGGAAYYSGLFMCSLCGQYVSLANGEKNRPHFKHSSKEKSKDCPERTFGYGYTPPYDEKQHELPLKINLNGTVSFSLGLICVPDHLLKKNTYVEINLPGCNSSFKYLSDRLLINQVTYLSVGNIPSEEYELTTYNASPGIKQYWPTKIKGIDPTGTWFDAQTGKKLPYDADVVINKPYYLVVKRRPVSMSDDIVIQDIANIYGSHHLKVYKVMALKYSREAACFFLDKFSSAQLTSFNTKGNQSFYNLIKSQFMMQPVVPGKEDLPNQGKKVLLFSDSRQRAAKLARDMSDASDTTAVRQLFALAINDMENSSYECSMDKLYDYFCLEVVKHHLNLFYGQDKDKLDESCIKVKDNYQRAERRKKEYKPQLTTNNAPEKMLEYIIRMFAGGYNTLYESAISWLEPTEDVLYDVIDSFEQNGVDMTEEDFLQAFNAWVIYICDRHTALGQTIADDVRREVRRVYDGYGIKKRLFPKKCG